MGRGDDSLNDKLVEADLVNGEIEAEQVFVDRVYLQLEESARNAQQLAREGQARGSLGHEGGLVERDAMVFQAARRIAQLDAAHEGLVFGRLDMQHSVDREPRYIGRIGLRDGHRDSMLIDWRAPAAAVFYQATAADPRKVVRRRVLRSSGPKVVGVEDELLDSEALAALEADGVELPIVGEGALMAQLSRARDRQMHSIVATIQAEQDLAIRAPSRGVVSISGGPGTGKTVVALHRVAYLLYNDRRRYESGGVLVVGPSGVFMRYIERVLPSLGEAAVALRSRGRGRRRAARDPSRRAGGGRHQGLGPDGDAAAAGGAAAGAGQPGGVPRLLARRRAHPRSRRPRAGPPAADVAGPAQPAAAPGGRRPARRVVEPGPRRARPRPGPGGVRRRPAQRRRVPGLRGRVVAAARRAHRARLAARPRAARARSPTVCSAHEEQRLLAKSWGSGDEVDLSVEDVPLVDELRYALGDVPQRTDDERDLDETALLEGGVDMQELLTASDREYAPSGRAWAPPTHRLEDDPFSHVLIDEAQDLTPMQWRMVGRRGKTASWTIVGDPAQSSWPDPAEAAEARATALEGKELHEFHLSTNYRNSSEIYGYAAAYAQRVGLDADLPTAVRSTGVEPREVTGVTDLESATRAAVLDVAGRVSGTVGVVVPVARRSEANAWLASWPELAADAPGARAAIASSVAPSGEDRVVVLTGLDTKGLEFDAIVVVRPEEIEAESVTGRSTLYVVLTRATQLLTTIS